MYMFLPDKDTRLFIDSYNEYYSVVFSVAYSKIGDVDTAKDLTQEVFTRFFLKISGIENHRRWLLSALKFVILEHFKKNNTADVNIAGLDEDINASFVNGFRDSRIIIGEALENMSNFGDEKGKIVFDLVTVYNYTYKEVGTQLGMTERQVRYQYTRTVKNLVDYFKAKGIKGLEDLL
jgi:RNA polymerase sigma factor (sigma-70 family)